MESNTKNALKKIEVELNKIKNKTFRVMFFVYDTKGAPSGSLSYIYEIAYQLKELGYNVQMIHAENEFIGVESWLGEKYSSLPHFHIKDDNVHASPADILFIPELYANVMSQTKSMPCKRVVILQNFTYATEIIPAGVSWDDLKIRECLTTSDILGKRLSSYFPDVQMRIVRPSIQKEFKCEKKPKQLVINLVAKDWKDINNIVKPFYWKYPIYAWVTFRPIINATREDFAKASQESFATIWCDSDTDFGYSAIEAMSAGNILIGKVPENENEWMYKDGNLRNNGVWFYASKDAIDLVAGIVQSFLLDNIPDSIFEEMKDTVETYTIEKQIEDIKENIVNGIFAQREQELEISYNAFKKKEKE